MKLCEIKLESYTHATQLEWAQTDNRAESYELPFHGYTAAKTGYENTKSWDLKEYWGKTKRRKKSQTLRIENIVR